MSDVNDLLKEFARLGLNERQGMELLADSNAISDLAIRVWDIAAIDIPAAVLWLQRRKIRYDGNDAVIVLR